MLWIAPVTTNVYKSAHMKILARPCFQSTVWKPHTGKPEEDTHKHFTV